MQGNVKVHLGYLSAALADACNLMPELDKASRALTLDEIISGELSSHCCKALYGQRPKPKNAEIPPKVDADEGWPLRVIVCPLLFGLRPEHGHPSKLLPEVIAPLFFFGLLERNGKLSIDPDNRLPVTPRNFLEPSAYQVTVGTVQEVDLVYARLPRATDWNGLIQNARKFCQDVCGQDWETLQVDQYERLNHPLIMLATSAKGATQNIQTLLDHLRHDSDTTLGLLETLITPAAEKPLLSAEQQLVGSIEHLGQMECRYGLSPSQRESLVHFFSLPDAVTAVDGPPGTGKTTLLLSVIASLWIKHARAQQEPPLIVASSTNNQAVLNILEAFAKVKEREGPLAGRWIKDLESYGLYLPAKSRENDKQGFRVHALKGMGKHSVHDFQITEKAEGLERARDYFLECAQKALGPLREPTLETAMTQLHARLDNCCSVIERVTNDLIALNALFGDTSVSEEMVNQARVVLQASINEGVKALEQATDKLLDVQKSKLAWKRHVGQENVFLTFLAWCGLTSFRTRRDEIFFAQVAIDHGESLGSKVHRIDSREAFDALITEQAAALSKSEEQLQKQLTTVRESLATLNEIVARLESFSGAKGQFETVAIQNTLDMGLRFDAFKWATHYWEARYLLEIEETLARFSKVQDTQSPERIERQYRRLAKLFPCSVVTLYSLPNRYSGWSGQYHPLLNCIDLLIVDEAGQVASQIGIPAFALAKRAMVVGDVDQIAPVHGLPQSIDLANAQHFGLMDKGWDAFSESGKSASSGNLMQVAQQATPYTKHAKRGRGMFLSEHRRCWRDIIEICNELVYKQLLKPCREEGPRRFNPSLGYVHLTGLDQRVGKSRCNLVEAQVIGQWLQEHRAEIESSFAEDKKPFKDLVAVVTPFAAQTSAIRQALDRSLGTDHGITVGTVHSLQGAERRVIIFSPTYGLDTEPGSPFFDKDAGSLLNVAISRAQDAFLVFGNMNLFNPVGKNPSAILGKHLFKDERNELKGIPLQWLVPAYDPHFTEQISDLEGHRKTLRSAFQTARERLIVVSPYLTKDAIKQDDVLTLIREACARGVSVVVISSRELCSADQKKKDVFDECVRLFKEAGAKFCNTKVRSVHAKLLLVDDAWLAVGSFNWLSSVRQPLSDYSFYESSIRYDGESASVMIQNSMKDLRQLLGGAST
ncbi:Phospholipase D-like domain containing protein [Pseudomonas sp. GM30]|nr:Phospholipase D-like domain containing protein [Pseudomonas sp. GM30]